MPDYFTKILDDFDAIVFFDTETSGLEPLEHQIIELAAISVVRTETGALRIEDKMDDFIRLPEGEQLRPEITELTHITDAMLQEEGKEPAEVAARFHRLIAGAGVETLNPDHMKRCAQSFGKRPAEIKPRRVLLAAHNAQFDLLFTRQLLKGHRLGVELKFLDTLTVYKDRAAYPHKLEAAIRHYKLESKVQNSHRAIDDVCALLEVTKAMDEERADIHTYINVFGYNPKYGISGEKIAGITYHAQDFTKFKRPERLTLPALAK